MDDFYTILGVPPNAAIAEIKDRYRFLAHAYHPDKFSSDAHKRDADEAFKKINEAFQTLSNPSLRADYDRRRASGPANHPKSSPPPSPAPPPQQQPKAPHSGGLLPLSPRMIVLLIIAAGIGVAVLLDKPSSPLTKTPQKDDWGGIAVDPASPRPAFDPSKPFAQLDPVSAPPKSAFDPTTAKPTGFEDLGAIPAPPPGFVLDATTQKPAPRRAPVQLPEKELRSIKGLSVNDKQGFLSIHNESTWTLTSVDFAITVFENRLNLPAKRQTFRYTAIRKNNDEGRPNADSRFSCSPFDSDSLGTGFSYVDRRVTWEIVSAFGLKPE